MGSGGLALVVETGAGVADEGRIEVGDLVHICAGKFDALSPKAGRDPMFTDFRIQGYETPDGSHQQFVTAQATQLFEPPLTLDLTEASSYILTRGTIYRTLTNTLDVEPGGDLFVEGASTGTGRDAVGTAASRGLDVTGLVSSDERAERTKGAGADAAIDRTQDALAGAMEMVPNDPDAVEDWVAAGEPLLEQFRAKNDGELTDYAVSHAGQAAFSRTYQLLDEGGRLTFYGASTGYEMAFVGKGGVTTPGEIYDRSALRLGGGVLVWYGTPDEIEDTTDEVGEATIEAALNQRARVAVVTETVGPTPWSRRTTSRARSASKHWRPRTTRSRPSHCPNSRSRPSPTRSPRRSASTRTSCSNPSGSPPASSSPRRIILVATRTSSSSARARTRSER